MPYAHVCTLCCIIEAAGSSLYLDFIFDWIKFIVERKSCINKTGKWPITAKFEDEAIL